MAFWKRKTPTPQEQVTRAIDSIERANTGMVRLAHIFALLLVVATSVASLISLASEVLIVVLSGKGSIPQDTSIAITLLLVLAMDSGMLLASSQIRIGRQRGESLRSLGGHVALMIFVALLEAGTYSYMLVLYEQPKTLIAWVLIIARAFAVPCLSIYLSMAQRNTVTTNDISYLTEMYSGVGLLRDIAEAANDPTASLPRKISIYRAAATLSPAQRARLNAMYAAVTATEDGLNVVDADPMPAPAQREIEALPPPDECLRMPIMTSTAPTAPAPKMAPRKSPAKRKKAPTKRASVPPPDEREAQVYAYLDGNPGTSARQLAAAIGLSVTAAQQDLRSWKAARKATRQPGPVYARSRKAAPPEPLTIADTLTGLVEDGIREWVSAHPTATAEDVMKEFSISEDYAAELLGQTR